MLPLHAPILETRCLHWQGEADCQAWAAELATRPALRNAFISLQGPLGAGKTTLVRHLLRALGVTGRIKSPTYAVLEPHQAGSLAISHFDFYRFADPREWLDAGFRDLFAQPGLKLAEWPEKAEGVLPVPDLSIELQPGDGAQDADQRTVTLRAATPTGLALLA
jgi:tRNA threonylcarbamoyladenosine biosynthesis protein TsaE